MTQKEKRNELFFDKWDGLTGYSDVKEVLEGVLRELSLAKPSTLKDRIRGYLIENNQF